MIALALGSSECAEFCLSIYWNVGRIKITDSANTLQKQRGKYKQKLWKPTQRDKWGQKKGRHRETCSTDIQYHKQKQIQLLESSIFCTNKMTNKAKHKAGECVVVVVRQKD